ncbi:transposase [Paenibacillus sp. FSL H7-0331]|uniref:transposase n=1 Tax=Paenibacillus sp. FSL H7-0331 TaxID=1920421 RepID=UPI003558E9F0
MPRDRQGKFEPIVVKKHQSNVSGIEDQIIDMYARWKQRCAGHVDRRKRVLQVLANR